MKVPYTIGSMLFMQPRYIGEEQDVYKARIADLSIDYISIEMPFSEQTGKMGFFLDGSDLDVWFYAEDGTKYSFRSNVLGRRKEQIPLTLITHPFPDSINRIQRRQFVRISSMEEIAIHPLEKGAFKPFLTRTVDLSGGGLAFYLPNRPPVKEGDKVQWWLSLMLKSNEILHPCGQARVIRVIEPEEKGLPYKCPLQFETISESDRLKIIKFTFEKQLELRKKGIMNN